MNERRMVAYREKLVGGWMTQGSTMRLSFLSQTKWETKNTGASLAGHETN